MKKLFAFLLLVVSTALAKDVQLGWTHSPPADAGPVGYNLYWAQGTNAIFMLHSSTTNKTALVTNLSPGIYRFQVTATNAWGETLPSNVLQTPGSVGAPPQLVVLIVVP